MSNKKEKDFSKLIIELDDCKLFVRKLQENEKMIYSMIDAVSDSIYLVDKNSQYLFVNDEILSRVGLPREKVLGKTFSEFHSPEESKGFVKMVDEVFKTGKSIKQEHESKRLNKWFLRTISPVKDYKTGKITSAAVVSKDISELKQAKEELEKVYQELRETTAQLVHNERMSALGELTAGVAHELNQPLNNIKIVCQGILLDINKNRLDIEILPQNLKDLIEQVNKMAEIIDHMRLFTRRLDSVASEEINVNDSINNMFMLFGEQFKQHDIDIVRDLSPNLPKISGNSVALEQIFTNLMNNARSAVEDFRKNERKIEIKSFMNNKNEVAVSIKDNGGGVPSNIRDRIFEPFFTSKPPGKGVGLGLSITKKIVQEHNGKIELEVEEGSGSTFTIILPVIGKNRKGN